MTNLTANYGGSGYLAGLFSGNVDIYVEGLQADSDFSITYSYTDASGTQTTTSIHTAIADVQIIDGNGNVVTSVDTNEYVLPSALTDGDSAAFIDRSVAQTEYRVRIVGLTSREIQYLTVTSDVGDRFQIAATSGSMTVGQSQVPYVESSVPFVIADNGGQPLTAAQQGQILSQFGVNAVDPGHIVDVGGMAEAKATLEAFKKQLPVTPPTAGLDVTQAIIYGSQRLKAEYDKLTYLQKVELAMHLLTPPYGLYAWDIQTLKFKSTDKQIVPGHMHSQTMCAPGQGLNETAPKTLLRCGMARANWRSTLQMP